MNGRGRLRVGELCVHLSVGRAAAEALADELGKDVYGLTDGEVEAVQVIARMMREADAAARRLLGLRVGDAPGGSPSA